MVFMKEFIEKIGLKKQKQKTADDKSMKNYPVAVSAEFLKYNFPVVLEKFYRILSYARTVC